MDAVARKAIDKVLAKSVARRREYGGMIYFDPQTKEYVAGPPRTDYDSASVDIGLSQPNKGCPEGTQPVAYYHTHADGRISPADRAEQGHFSEKDKWLANENKLEAAYLGTVLRQFVKYDCQTKKPEILDTQLRIQLSAQEEKELLQEDAERRLQNQEPTPLKRNAAALE